MPAIPTTHVSNTNSFRSELDEAALCDALIAELEAAIEAEGPETVAAIFAEPIQNAGGCFVPPEGYWPRLCELAHRHGILVVADEVISGMGRLGEWFASTRFGATPDIVIAAKGVTSAQAPLGAVLVSERVAALPPATAAGSAGNHVVVKLGRHRYALYAHLQPGSIGVRVGQRVSIGDQLGRLGSSGNSNAPHLHFHLMDGPNPLASNGIPYRFSHFTVAGTLTNFAGLFNGDSAQIAPRLRGAHRAQLPMNQQVIGFGG